MTLFEYISVAVSIILGLGLTHLLSNMTSIFNPATRYLGHAGWVLALVFMMLQIWWALWDLSSDFAWTQFRFYYILLGPVILYVAATTLVPRRQGVADSWEAHYAGVRIPFLMAMTLFIPWGTSISWLTGMGLFHPYRLVQLGACILIVAGLLTRNRSFLMLQGWLVLLWVLGSQAIFRSLPGAFTGTL